MAAAGLRWMIVASPRYWAERSALAPYLRELLPPARQQAFARHSGVDALAVEHLVVAGYDFGEVYLTDASGWAAPPEQHFLDRTAGSGSVHSFAGGVWGRGLVGTTPQFFVRLDRGLLAIAVRDPTPARVVRRLARGPAPGIVPALEGASLRSLSVSMRRPGPLSAYLSGPLERSLPELAARGGALGRADAIGLALRARHGELLLQLEIAGAVEAPAGVAELKRVWDDVAASEVGQLLSLDQPSRPPAFAQSGGRVGLQAALVAQRVGEALVALATGDPDRISRLPALSRPSP